MKLLLLINGLANSGSEQSLINFINFLDKDKYETTVLVLKGPDTLATLIDKKVKISYLYKDNPYFDAPLLKGCIKSIKDKKYNYILPLFLCGILRLSKSKLFTHTINSVRKKVLAPSETFDVAFAYEYVTMKYLINRVKAKKKIVRHNYGEIIVKQKDKDLFDKCDGIVALTPLLKEELAEKFSVSKEKISVIPSNFDNETIFEKSQEFKPDYSAKYNFVSVGRITELKRFDLIIKSMKILKNMGFSDFQCHLVGGTVDNKDNERYFEYIKKLVADLDLEKEIDFVGETLNPFPYVADCDIYLQASDFEAASRSVIEALILGIPCLSTETVGGKALIIPHKNGELAPVGNAEIFAQKLIDMIKNIDLYSHTPNPIDNEKIMENYYKLFNL